ncbi:hypothetical protein [Paracoccus sp. SY]|uniref:hypothetical protein n=1 Tax=Paracoccus sp. SY TaxID=1330255 RepID=UPI000CD0EFB5|nr:hypothetical protein [Paracoccus sp. SY]
MAKNPLNSASADDLVAMGLPPAFTLDDMREFLDPAEIAAQAEGDDPLVDELPDDIKASLVKSKSAHDELNPGLEDDDEGDAGDGSVDDDDDSGDDAGADDDSDDDDDDAGTGEDDGDDAQDDGSDADDAGQGEAQDDAEAPEADQTPDPVLTLKDTADLEAKVSGFDDQIDALQQQYDDGELANADFKAKLREITTEQAKATVELERAKDANTKAQEDYAQAWYGKVNAFTATRPELMDNTKPIPGEPNGATGYQVFDQALKHINSPAGAEQFGHLNWSQRLEAASILANEYVKKHTGTELLAPKAAPKTEDTPAPKKKAEQPGPRKDPRPAPVKTLANVPAATDNDVQDSRFAALDRMDPLDAEAALDRMSESERAKYLAG